MKHRGKAPRVSSLHPEDSRSRLPKSVLSASCLGFPWDSDCHTAPCDSPHHPLLFWVQVWYHFTPYILQKQMGSRGNSEGGRSLSKCRHSRFRSSVLFQPMMPWWVVNLSWQNWSNKTKQLYGTFELKGLLILGETGFLSYKCVSKSWISKRKLFIIENCQKVTSHNFCLQTLYKL